MNNIEEKFESHPFKPHEPSGATVLILGSFPGRGANGEGDWYYSAARNQFWNIFKGVYPNEKLETKEDKIALFNRAGIAIADIILIAKRKNNGNLDKDLVIIQDNKEAIQKIIEAGNISKILCTSRFVEKKFRALFPDYKNIDYLPSPSPIYRKMSIQEKIKIYSEKLPNLPNQ